MCPFSIGELIYLFRCISICRSNDLLLRLTWATPVVVVLFLCHKVLSFNAEFLSVFVSVPNQQFCVSCHILNGAIINFSVELKCQQILVLLSTCAVHITHPVRFILVHRINIVVRFALLVDLSRKNTTINVLFIKCRFICISLHWIAYLSIAVQVCYCSHTVCDMWIWQGNIATLTSAIQFFYAYLSIISYVEAHVI